MARKRRAKRQDEDLREASRIEKASYWLAHAITYAVKAATDTTDDRGDPAFKRRIERWKHDTQDTLAMSLDAYALAMCNKTPDRVDALSLARVATPEALDDVVYSAADTALRAVGEAPSYPRASYPALAKDWDYSVDAMRRCYPRLFARFGEERNYPDPEK